MPPEKRKKEPEETNSKKIRYDIDMVRLLAENQEVTVDYAKLSRVTRDTKIPHKCPFCPTSPWTEDRCLRTIQKIGFGCNNCIKERSTVKQKETHASKSADEKKKSSSKQTTKNIKKIQDLATKNNISIDTTQLPKITRDTTLCYDCPSCGEPTNDRTLREIMKN